MTREGILICRICGFRGNTNHLGSLLSHLQKHNITRGSRKDGASPEFLKYLQKYYGIPKCACGCGKTVTLNKKIMVFNFFANDCEEKSKFCNPTRPEFYLFKGYSVDKTIELIRKKQKKNVSEKIRLNRTFAGSRNPSSFASIQNRTGKSIIDIKNELSKQSSGDNNGFYGRKHNKETMIKLAKMRSMQSKIVTRPELVVYGILKALDIKFQYQEAIDAYVVDFLIGNLVLEVYGDFWHSEKFLNGLKKKKDDQRIQVFKDLGYDVCIFWESEIMKDTDKVVDKIKSITGIK